MSNNPLEAVTQAVNSLVTALKLPDESAKANEVLGEMSFPQFSRLLPYRDYNQESGLFMNDTTMGFMLEAIPINGANESIVEALDHMLRTKLPRGIPLCIHLMSSQLVGDRIEYGLREFSWSGEQAERFPAAGGDESAPDPAPLPGVYLVLFSLEEKKLGRHSGNGKPGENHPGVVTGGQYHHTGGGCTGLYRYCRGDD